MTGRNLTRRLERLEARITPTTHPVVINVRFVSSEGGSVVDQFSITVGDDRYNRYWQARPSQQRPTENIR